MDATGNNKKWGKIIGAVFGLLALTVAWNVWHYYYNAANVSQKEPWNIAQWWLYDKGLDRAIAMDNVGGDTPEAAMQGYITALEAGDIELAAKYYIPTKQGEVLSGLRETQQNENLKKYSEILRGLDIKEYSTTTNSYHIYTLNQDKMRQDDHVIVFNSISKKWKIAEP